MWLPHVRTSCCMTTLTQPLLQSSKHEPRTYRSKLGSCWHTDSSVLGLLGLAPSQPTSGAILDETTQLNLRMHGMYKDDSALLQETQSGSIVRTLQFQN